MTLTPRLQAMHEELIRSANEHSVSKYNYERARVKYEITKTQFAQSKEMASKMINSWSVNQWLKNYPNLKYAGSQIGVAIIGILEDRAFDAAQRFSVGKVKRFVPNSSIEDIAKKLDEGGFEFRSMTPMREVNAALIKLNGVEKVGEQGLYRLENAERYLEWFKNAEDEKINEVQEVTKDSPDDDLPW